MTTANFHQRPLGPSPIGAYITKKPEAEALYQQILEGPPPPPPPPAAAPAAIRSPDCMAVPPTAPATPPNHAFRLHELFVFLFSKMFQKNAPKQILKFLDEETSLSEDLQIQFKMPPINFIKALFQRAF